MIVTENLSNQTNPRTFGSYKLNDGNGNFNGTLFDFDVHGYTENGWTGKDIAFGYLRVNQQKDVGLGREACVQKFQNLNYSINSTFTAHSNQSNSISFDSSSRYFYCSRFSSRRKRRVAVYYNDGQGNLPITENSYTVSSLIMMP
jgi:hypothetical protein